MGKYKDMIMTAREKGIANEKTMWQEIDNYDILLEQMKEEHPDLYWKHIRKAHTSIYGKHYDEEFAQWDVDKIFYTDKDGIKKQGAHWTKQQVVDATKTLAFPQGVTDCDKFVAYNATYADFSKEFSEEDILKMAYLFWFKDEDWSKEGSGTKIWEYMCFLHTK